MPQKKIKRGSLNESTTMAMIFCISNQKSCYTNKNKNFNRNDELNCLFNVFQFNQKYLYQNSKNSFPFRKISWGVLNALALAMHNLKVSSYFFFFFFFFLLCSCPYNRFWLLVCVFFFSLLPLLFLYCLYNCTFFLSHTTSTQSESMFIWFGIYRISGAFTFCSIGSMNALRIAHIFQPVFSFNFKCNRMIFCIF